MTEVHLSAIPSFPLFPRFRQWLEGHLAAPGLSLVLSEMLSRLAWELAMTGFVPGQFPYRAQALRRSKIAFSSFTLLVHSLMQVAPHRGSASECKRWKWRF